MKKIPKEVLLGAMHFQVFNGKKRFGLPSHSHFRRVVCCCPFDSNILFNYLNCGIKLERPWDAVVPSAYFVSSRDGKMCS